MSLDALDFLEVILIQIVNAYVAMPVPACNLLPIEREPEASDGLLNVLSFAHLNVIVVAIVGVSNFVSFFIPLDGLGFEHIEVVLLDVVNVLDEEYFAHVFAICISEKAFLDQLSVLRGDRGIIYVMPEANGSVTCTGHKSGQTLFLLEDLALVGAGEPN